VIVNQEKFAHQVVTPALLNEQGLAWRPVHGVLAYVASEDPVIPLRGRMTAVVRFDDGVTLGIIRATYDGMRWEAMPRAAGDEGTIEAVVKGLHPVEAKFLKLDVQFSACQHCGTSATHDDVIPTEVRIGVKLKFNAWLCGTCSNVLVSLVRPFLKEVPPDDDGPRSIIV